MDEFRHEFWEMIWDCNVKIIVMLSKEVVSIFNSYTHIVTRKQTLIDTYS